MGALATGGYRWFQGVEYRPLVPEAVAEYERKVAEIKASKRDEGEKRAELWFLRMMSISRGGAPGSYSHGVGGETTVNVEYLDTEGWAEYQKFLKAKRAHEKEQQRKAKQRPRSAAPRSERQKKQK